MALPSSGQITINMIRDELGLPSQANFSLHTARQGGYVPLNSCSPYLPPSSGEISLSDWYGYSHSANKPSGLVTYNGVSFYYGSVNITIYKNGSVLAQRGPTSGNYGSIYIGNSYSPGDTIRVTAAGTPTSGGSITSFGYSVDGTVTDCLGALDTGTITILCGKAYAFGIYVGETPASGFHDVLISAVVTFTGYDGTGDRFNVQFQSSESLGTTITVTYSWRPPGGSWTSGATTHVLNTGGTTDSDTDQVTVSIGDSPEIRIDSITPGDDGSAQNYVG